jgi:hypothetical protein
MTEEESIEPREEGTKFNMAMLFYINLNHLVELKDAAYMNNDLEAWYKGLDRIFNKVVFKLKLVEEEELLNLFTDAKEEIINKSPAASETLHKIDTKLIKLMDVYKMIFPKIELNDGFEKLNKRYGRGVFE